MESKIYKINIRGQEIEVEQLPDGKFKVPAISQFVNVQSGCTWLDNVRIPYQSEDDKPETRERTGRIFDPAKGWNQNNMVRTEIANEKGRFPANLIVSDDSLNDGKIRKITGGKCIENNLALIGIGLKINQH